MGIYGECMHVQNGIPVYTNRVAVVPPCRWAQVLTEATVCAGEVSESGCRQCDHCQHCRRVCTSLGLPTMSV